MLDHRSPFNVAVVYEHEVLHCSATALSAHSFLWSFDMSSETEAGNRLSSLSSNMLQREPNPLCWHGQLLQASRLACVHCLVSVLCMGIMRLSVPVTHVHIVHWHSLVMPAYWKACRLVSWTK